MNSMPIQLDQQLTIHHLHRKRIMVFDVETTGLLPKKDPILKTMPTIDEFPHILQLSFVIYNTKFWCIEKTFDKYIRVPDSVEISAKITELTGITRELCSGPNSTSIDAALAEFYYEYCHCDCIVAHNIDFDKTMIRTELERNKATIQEKCPYYSCIFDTSVRDNLCASVITILTIAHVFYIIWLLLWWLLDKE